MQQIQAEQLGYAVIAMGGGRQRAADVIDHSVGLEMLVRIGDRVTAGQPLVRLYCHDPQAVGQQVLASLVLSESPVLEPLPLIHSRLTMSDHQFVQQAG